MGLISSYLEKPITDKESSDETSDKLVCGASCMQGWRCSQEDAHNCILDYDTDTAFFAVYDGHGGHEVAQYCSEKLPEFIKNLEEYKKGNFEEALKLGFLGFDAHLLEPEVVKTLESIARNRRGHDSDSSEVEEDDVNNLYEEAAMPIEKVIEKYQSKSAGNVPEKAKKDKDENVGACSSTSLKDDKETVESSTSSSSQNEAESTSGKNENDAEAEASISNTSEAKEEPSSSDTKEEAPIQNGEVSTPSAEEKCGVSSSPVENGTPSNKGKGKARIKPEPVKSSPSTRPKRNAKELYQNWLECGEESEEDDSDEEDQTFEGCDEESSEDDSEGVNIAIDAEEGEEESSEEEIEDEEHESDDDDEDISMKSGPGVDSGCTAVVALLRGNELYVANAGDSRCVVCRDGQAIEMSFDHKPGSKIEYARIKKAGGRVSDGRVNDGLNLSRAIGDHTYKQNKKLSDREQMITALPDIQQLTINPNEDEFMVLACDGIWNSLSSQEVVDFIRPRLSKHEKLSKICEEMFDSCLAQDTFFDSAGCDNMTAMIIKFKSAKRAASPQEAVAKKAKTDSSNETQADTTV